MNNYLITKPVREPVTLSQAKDHLNIDYPDDDAFLELLITTAREAVENQTGRKLISTTMAHSRDSFSAEMELPYTAKSVTTIQYIDADGATQTLAATEYVVDVNRTPARVTLAFNKTFPATQNTHNAVTITYVSGYGDNAEDVPAPFKQAMLLLIGNYHERREEGASLQIHSIPMGVKFLLNPYKIYLL